VHLTVYAGDADDFMRTPLEKLARQIAAGALPIPIGKTFRLEEIVEAHRCMEENRAGGKIVVLP
jgi:NADPH:quinone reductase-like Zn-dependent oxidoreductase